MRRAVIDIGTNSVKLLVAQAEGEQVFPLYESSEQTRLGAGFYESHRLQPAAIATTARAVTRFAETARSWQVESVRVIATSAARDATNQNELLDQVQSACGLSVEVISGEQEAEWAFLGVCTDPQFANQPLLILDVGGGSTECIAGERLHRSFRRSFPVGTVRLLEKVRPADPPTQEDWVRCEAYLAPVLDQEVKPALVPALKSLGRTPPCLVGTGGTTTILAAMELKLDGFDRERIEHTRLPQGRVWEYQQRLWSMSLAERRELRGLPPNRADVILFGVAVYALVMRALELEELRISTRGLRFAAVLGTGTRP